MNTALTYIYLMLLTLLALLGAGCTRSLNESPIEFEEKSTRHTENMTPEEWDAFKNKAIESIIRKYTGQKTAITPGHVTVVDLTQPATPSTDTLEGPTPSVSVNRLEDVEKNKLHIPEKLSPVNLPNFKSPPVKSADKTLEKVERYSQLKIKPEETKGKQYKVPPNAVAQLHVPSLSKEEVPTVSSQYVWPVKGTLSMGYGKSANRTNNGINIKAKTGSPIVAIEKGKVIFVGAIKGMGKVVLIEHPNQMIAAYAQIADINVRASDTVKKGQRIATILSTEGSQGELHFELRKGTQSLNPEEYLPK